METSVGLVTRMMMREGERERERGEEKRRNKGSKYKRYITAQTGMTPFCQEL